MRKLHLLVPIPVERGMIKADGIYEITLVYHGPFGKKEKLTKVQINPLLCEVIGVETEEVEVEQDAEKSQ